MSEEKEILRYELDLADVEAKAQRLKILTEQMRAATEKGQDTSELQRQIQGEVNGLASLGVEQKKALSSGEELIRHKEKLTTVVSLMGGSFGAAAGQIGNMVAMLVSMNPTLIGVAAGLAALTIGVQVYKGLEEGARKAREEQERYNDAVAAGQKVRQAGAAGIGEQLEQWGKRSGQNVAAAMELTQRLGQQWGVAEPLAGKVAALSTAAGLGEESAAVLRVLLGAGAQIGTPEEALAAIAAEKQRGTYAARLEQAQGYARDTIGQQVRAQRLAPGFGGPPGLPPALSAYESLKGQPGGLAASGLPSTMTFEEFRDAASARQLMAEMEQSGQAYFLGPRGDDQPVSGPGQFRYRRLRDSALKYAWLDEYVAQQARAQSGVQAASGPAFNAPAPAFSDAELMALTSDPYPGWRGPDARSVRGAVTIINQSRTGTVIQLDTNKKVHTPGRARMGGSDHDVMTPI